jgi:hypothetical protein
MPNGGTDNCASCILNKAREIGDRFIDQPEEREKLFRELCHCIIRDVKISDPYWTYCDNYFYFRDHNPPGDDTLPIGPIFLVGLNMDVHKRIPWNGNNEPRLYQPVTCHICGREVAEGIAIEHAGVALGFCSNRHYVQWWLTLHEDKRMRVEDFKELMS